MAREMFRLLGALIHLTGIESSASGTGVAAPSNSALYSASGTTSSRMSWLAGGGGAPKTIGQGLVAAYFGR